MNTAMLQGLPNVLHAQLIQQRLKLIQHQLANAMVSEQVFTVLRSLKFGALSPKPYIFALTRFG